MTSAKRTRGNGSCLKSTGGGCAILFIGIGIWWMTAQSTPVVHIPAPVLPSPNGFDTLCSAGKQLLDYRKIGFAVNLTHLPGDKDDREYTLTEKERLVHENFASLKLLRESLQEDYWNPPIRSVSTVLPYYMQFRSLALLLELDSMVKAAHHDYGGAIQTNLDAIEMGATIENGSLMMGGLAGDLCQTGGCRMAWSYIDRLDSAHAQAACHRLEAIQKHRVPTWKIVQEEKWLGQAELLEVFQNPS